MCKLKNECLGCWFWHNGKCNAGPGDYCRILKQRYCMPTKVFTTISGPCPFGKNVTIDSPGCRSCEKYYRAGTGMFFWCNHPVESVPKTPESVPKTPESVPKTPESVPKTRKTVPKATKDVPKTGKRGRPAAKAKKKPVKTRKKKNG